MTLRVRLVGGIDGEGGTTGRGAGWFPVLNSFRLYDLFILSFVQLIVATVLVLNPARHFDTRFRWTGSRITEVLLGALGVVAVAVSCFLTVQLWGLPRQGVEASAYLLVIFSLVVVIVRPDCSVVGKVFYASFAAAGFTFLAFSAVVAENSTLSIAETMTASLLILLEFGALLVWITRMRGFSRSVV